MDTKQQLRSARESLGESQAEFGKRFGVDQTTIHRWETLGVPERGSARIAVRDFLQKLEASQAA